jgi:hypothetical protein
VELDLPAFAGIRGMAGRRDPAGLAAIWRGLGSRMGLLPKPQRTSRPASEDQEPDRGAAGPGSPRGPRGPVGPCAPSRPRMPLCPLGPVLPVGPRGPALPVDPVDPVGPRGPVGPVLSFIPAGSIKTSRSGNAARKASSVPIVSARVSEMVVAIVTRSCRIVIVGPVGEVLARTIAATRTATDTPNTTMDIAMGLT